MPVDAEKLREDLVYGFASWCDSNALSLTTGLDLAEKLGDDLASAADDRRAYLPANLIDDEPEEHTDDH